MLAIIFIEKSVQLFLSVHTYLEACFSLSRVTEGSTKQAKPMTRPFLFNVKHLLIVHPKEEIQYLPSLAHIRCQPWRPSSL